MKYPASKHYSHLSVHDPIPEIELRYNEHHRVAYGVFRKWVLPAVIIVIVFQFMLNMLIANAFVLMGMSVVVNLLIFSLLLVFVHRAQQRAGTIQDVSDKWGIPLREQIWYQFFFVIFFWITSSAHQFSVQDISKALFSLVFYLFLLGIGFALFGRFARQPGQISCMKCDYPLVGLQLPCPCPECGTTISYFSDATDRPRARDTRLVLIGIAIAVLSLVTIVLRFYRPQALYTAMPRAALIQLAPNDHGAFESLMGTAMTLEEEELLIEGMFESRTGFSSGSSYEQGEWFGNMITQGRLSTDQLTELYAEYVRIEIDAPDQVRVGDSARLTLRAKYVRASPDMWYFFHGFQIDEDPTLLGQMDRVLSRTFIVNGPKQDNIDRGYVPITTWTPETTGTYTIRARIIFALGSGYSFSKAVVWTDEDLPEYPNPPIWSRMIDLEHTIEVVNE